MIEGYSFGRIVIGGREYRSDVIVTPDGVLPNWRRREGHRLRVEDLEGLLDLSGLDALVIGTGYYGVMRVPEEAVEELRRRGVKEVIVRPTREACEAFNELLRRGLRVAAALHLTC